MVIYNCQFGWPDKAWEPNESHFRAVCVVRIIRVIRIYSDMIIS